MIVHVSQFYSCSSVNLACELYYICELGKYLFHSRGKKLSIDGVLLHTDLQRSAVWEYFRMAVDNGWVIDTGITSVDFAISARNPLNMDMTTLGNFLFTIDPVPFDREDQKLRAEDPVYDMKTPVKMQTSFEQMTDDYWLWTLGGKDGRFSTINNAGFNNMKSQYAWVSLIAMVAVERLFTGKPNKLMIYIDYALLLSDLALSYMMLLNEETICLTGWCFFSLAENVSENKKLQLGYFAWYARGKDCGYMDKLYTGKDKFAYIHKMDLQVGDLVMLYDRERAQKHNFVKTIVGCHLAKITFLTQTAIGLELINTVKTKFQGKEDFDDNTIVVKRMYQGKPPYSKLNISKRTYDLVDIGVEYMLYGEVQFIVPLDHPTDFKVTRVTDGIRKDTLILPQNDFIYWMLKDYNYDFNEERFLSRYFDGVEPAYTRYMRGETLEPEYYFTAVDLDNSSEEA